jgi:predicted HicB family RNase H-like nuclease
MPEDGDYDAVINVRVTERMRRRAHMLAKAEGSDLSTYLREHLRSEIEKQGIDLPDGMVES